MIPAHLQGKSAVQIIDDVTLRFISGSHDNGEDYIKYLEMLLLLAVEDALINGEGVDHVMFGIDAKTNEKYSCENRIKNVEERAILFLNII